MNPMDLDHELRGVPCVVTGGASFIGSHLVEALLRSGASVTVIDDFSSGNYKNLSAVQRDVHVVEASVLDEERLGLCLKGKEIVFHLAAIHGGRGFIDTYEAQMTENLAIDWHVFSKCAELGVRRVVHASSACAYPISLQADPNGRDLLSEEEAGFLEPSQSFPDGAYGWAKLMGEFQLATISKASPEMSGRSARIFTAYGSRENESHAAVALWAKAALEFDPYPIWGNGMQTRNFTHVLDTVRGILNLAVDPSTLDFDVFNVGSSTHHTVLDFVNEIFRIRNWKPENLDLQLDKPVGVASRAASNDKMIERFGWEPSISLTDGITEMGEWYDVSVLPFISREILESRLIAR